MSCGTPNRVFISCLAFAVAMFAAARCVAQEYYGAIAYSTSTHSWAACTGHALTAAEAKAHAVRECRGADAVAKVWGKNTWLALATSSDKAVGWAYAETAAAAKSRAIRECSNHARAGSTITVDACVHSSGSSYVTSPHGQYQLLC